MRAETHLEPDSEYQEAKPDLREEIDRRRFLHEVEAAMPDRDAGKNHADHQRKPQRFQPVREHRYGHGQNRD